MTSILQATFSPWWLVVPAAILIWLLFFVIRRRRFFDATLMIISLFIASVTIIAMPASHIRDFHASLDWAKHITGGDGWRSSTFFIQFQRGGVRLSFQANDFGIPFTKVQTGRILSRLIAYPNSGYRVPPYPIWLDRFSLTKSDFIQKKVGFQLCWHNGPDPDGSGQVSSLYSITLPLWLVLALSLIAPIWRLKRYLRERHQRRRGFPVAAHIQPAPQAQTPPP